VSVEDRQPARESRRSCGASREVEEGVEKGAVYITKALAEK
jgi:hypothetical protein